MPIPLFNNFELVKPLLPELKARIAAVCDSGRFILGPELEAFEREFASYLGVGHVVGVANGTEALTLSLRALGIGPGDEVVVPSFTFYATAEAVPHTGAKPVFCDVDPRTYCITAESVERVLTRRTRAVVAVHLFGNAAKVDELLELSAERGLYLVEDTAQAAGAEVAGLRAGSFGHAGAFSFYPSKNLFCFGDGGAVATSSEKVANVVRSLRSHGSSDKRSFKRIGYNSRLDEIQATILRALLPRLDGWNRGRGEVASKYKRQGLGSHLVLPKTSAGVSHVYNLYVAQSANRDRLIDELGRAGIEARNYYTTPIHAQPPMHEFAGSVELPVTEDLARTNIALPMGPRLSDEGIEEVVKQIADLG